MPDRISGLNSDLRVTPHSNGKSSLFTELLQSNYTVLEHGDGRPAPAGRIRSRCPLAGRATIALPRVRAGAVFSPPLEKVRTRDTSPCRRPPSVGRTGWLRAAVLGANDGIISTASLIVGVASADGSPGEVLTAGVAGFGRWRDVDGGWRIRVGQFAVGLRSCGVIARERQELRDDPESEHRELAAIYVRRGLGSEAGPSGRRGS